MPTPNEIVTYLRESLASLNATERTAILPYLVDLGRGRGRVEEMYDPLLRMARTLAGDAQAEGHITVWKSVDGTRIARMSEPRPDGVWISPEVIRKDGCLALRWRPVWYDLTEGLAASLTVQALVPPEGHEPTRFHIDNRSDPYSPYVDICCPTKEAAALIVKVLTKWEDVAGLTIPVGGSLAIHP